MTEPKPIPQQTPNVTVTGTVVFSCCGESFSQELYSQREVRCVLCSRVFDLVLEPTILGDEKYPSGTQLKIIKEVITKAGSTQITFVPGQIVKTGIDIHRVLGCSNTETLAQVEVPTPAKFGGAPRVLLAPVPDDSFELL